MSVTLETTAAADWNGIALNIGDFYQKLYSWSQRTQLLNEKNPAVVYEANRLFAFTLEFQAQKNFEFPRMDISEEYRIDRRMKVNISPGQKYLVICDEGDQWHFNAIFGDKNKKAVVNVITTGPVDTNSAFDLKEEYFEREIPFHENIHLLAKAGKKYVVRLITNDMQGAVLNEMTTNGFALRKYTKEAKMFNAPICDSLVLGKGARIVMVKQGNQVAASEVHPIADICLTPRM